MKNFTHRSARNKVSPGQVYYNLQYGFGLDGAEGVLDIGIFSSRAVVLANIKKLKKKKGFRRGKGKFWISRGVIDEVEWGDGFISSKTYLRSIGHK
jgi:hypothetical protein